MSLITNEEVEYVFGFFKTPMVDVKFRHEEIDKIDGIDVNIHIYYNVAAGLLQFKIQSDHLYTYAATDFEDDEIADDEDEIGRTLAALYYPEKTEIDPKTGVTKEDIRNILLYIENVSKVLLFDRRICTFKTYRRTVTDINCIRGEKCCVCHELTISTSKCDHYLCLECFQKLTHKRRCPICRNFYITMKRPF